MKWIPVTDSMPTEADGIGTYRRVSWSTWSEGYFMDGECEPYDYDFGHGPGPTHWMSIPPLTPEPTLAQQLGRQLTERKLWREGMQTMEIPLAELRADEMPVARYPSGCVCERCAEERALVPKGYPDLDDPPTWGALLGLAIEVCGGPVALLPDGEGWEAGRGSEWLVGTGPTPGAALGALLLSVWESE